MYRLLIGLFCLLPLSSFAGGLIGLAYVDNLVGLNLEWTMSRSSVYAIPAVRFTQGTGGAANDLRWIAGARHVLDKKSMAESGFFIGVTGGDYGSTMHYRRNGYGGEIGYQLVKKYTRWTFNGGFVVLDQDGRRNLKSEPSAFLGISLSLHR